MKNSTTNRFLPLPPTSYQCPFSEEARTCQSNPIDTYLTSLPCPTNGEHFTYRHSAGQNSPVMWENSKGTNTSRSSSARIDVILPAGTGQVAAGDFPGAGLLPGQAAASGIG